MRQGQPTGCRMFPKPWSVLACPLAEGLVSMEGPIGRPTLPATAPDAVPVGVGCLIDVETTGLDASRHELIELAMVLFAFRRDTGEIVGILDEYVGQREPSRSIPRAATAVHGLRKRGLKGKALDLSRIESMLEQAEFIVAHNADFDRAFLRQILPTVDQKRWLCSLRDIDWYAKGYDSRKLHYLLERHGIHCDQAHRALADARACVQLLGFRQPTGRTYLSEMLFRPPRRPQPAARRRPAPAPAPEPVPVPGPRLPDLPAWVVWGLAVGLFVLLVWVATRG